MNNLSPFMASEATIAKACVLGLSPQEHLYQPRKVFGLSKEEYDEHLALAEIIPSPPKHHIELIVQAPADGSLPKKIQTKTESAQQQEDKKKNTPPPIVNPVAVKFIGLKKGNDRKEDTRELQTLLVKLRYMTQIIMNTGPGIFGSQTQQSVKLFQQENGLNVTGIVDNATLSALKTATPRKPIPNPSPPRSISVGTLTYSQNYIPKSKKHRPGYKMTPTTLTIHSTANPKSTAKNERNWLGSPSNSNYSSYHIVVDQQQIIECIPLHEVAWHSATKVGNTTSIGVEICESGDREATLENAIKLITKILHDKSWGVSSLRMHYDWSGKNCPRILRSASLRSQPHQTWEWFVGEVKTSLLALK